MAGIQDFISMATRNLGVSEDTASSATGGLLKMLQGGAESSDFSTLLEGLPGANALLEKAGAAPEGGEEEHGLGGLLHKVTGMFGGKPGGGAPGLTGLTGLLSGSGLQADKFGPFVSLFMGFVGDNLGGDLKERLLEKLPDLRRLRG